MEPQEATCVGDGTSRRIGNACVPCKSSKVRCDGKLPSCQRCLERRKTCHYGERRTRGRGKSKQYIETLEQRLKNVEVALQASPTANEESSPTSAESRQSHDTSNNHSTSSANQAQPLPSRWSEDITRNIIHAQKNKSNIERTVFAPLPLKEHIIHFISSALQDMYEAQWLFSTEHVLQLVNDQYSAGSSNSHANPTRWATLNALIATGVHWKADNNAIQELFPISWAWYKNAFAIFPEIVMNGNGIDSCQAMIAMALFMKGTADARAYTALLSASAHAIDCIGLYSEDLCESSDLVDIEMRKRSFWTIYVLRCNASLNLDIPAPYDQVRVELPSLCLASDTGSSTHQLRHMSTLALIQSRISRYSGLSLSKSSDKMMQALAKLDNDLESWRTGLPTHIQPPPSAKVANLDIIQLHLSYYASTWKIYTALAKLCNVPLTSIEREQPNLHLSTLVPTQSARATISLLQGLSSQPFASLWQIICYPMCAVLILLTAVLHGPRDPQASLNIEWIEKFVVFLQSFQDREGCDLNGLIEFCSNLYHVASFAQRDPTDLVSESEQGTDLWRQYTDLRIRLQGSQDPMLLAQGLLTNMPLLGAKAVAVFSGVVVGARVDGFTQLVPNVLKPRSFNFFGYNKANNRR